MKTNNVITHTCLEKEEKILRFNIGEPSFIRKYIKVILITTASAVLATLIYKTFRRK